MWGSWTEWTMCPVTCGGGKQERTRSCDSPAPDNDGPDCIGSSTENKQCAPSVCPSRYTIHTYNVFLVLFIHMYLA